MKQLLPIIATLLLVPSFAGALQFAADEQLTLRADSGDSYVAGESVISTTVIGDLYAAGRSIMVSDTVTGDANIAGETITLNNVNDDLRAAGGAFITVHGTMNGEANLYAEHVIISGELNAPVRIEAERITINGRINAPITMVAPTINVDGAQFNNAVNYWTKHGEMNFESATVSQIPVYEDTLHKKQETKPGAAAAGIGLGISIGIVYSLLSAAVLLLIMLLIANTFFKKAGKLLLKTPWQSLFIGLLYYFVLPIVALLLMITVIGIPISIIALIVWGISLWLSTTIAALLLTEAWLAKTKRKWDWWQVWLGSLLMFFLLKIVMVVPILGWLAYLAAICCTMGALLQEKKIIWEKHVK